jgi:cation:H+ antiporter
VWKEIPFSLLAAIVLGLMANDRLVDGYNFTILTRSDGLVLLAFFAVFIVYSFSIAKAIDGMSEHLAVKALTATKASLFVLVGLLGLTLGGKWIVDGAVRDKIL